MSIINLIFFVLINIMLLFSAYLIMDLLKGNNSSKTKVFLGTATLFFTLIVIIEILLGVLGLLTYPMLVGVVTLLTTLIIFHQRLKVIQILKFEKKEKSSNQHNDSDYYLILALFFPALTLFAFRLFDGLFQIPFDFDAINYHLPIVVDWIQNSSVLTPYYSAMTSPLGHYPSNVELLYLWNIIPFSNDFFVDLINFLFYGLFVGGIYAVCRNFDFEKRISFIVSGIALYIPVFMHQAGLIFVDLFFIMTFVFGIFFLQEIAKQRNEIGNKILAGLALGLFIGTKYLGIIYIALPILAFFFINRKSKKYWSGVFQFFGALFTTGGYFYLRNWFESGNPIYPAEVSLAGFTIFPGYKGIEKLMSESSIWDHLSELETYKLFAHNFLLICDAPGVLMMLGLVFTFFYVIYRLAKKDKLKKLSLPILLLTSASFYFLTYIKAPYTHVHMVYNIRYMMPLIVIGIINWAYLMKISGRYQPALFIILLFAIARSFIYAIFSPSFKLLLNFEILSLYQVYLMLFISALVILFFVYPLLRNLVSKIVIGFLAIVILVTVINFAYEEREVLIPYYADRWYPQENMFWGDLQAALWLNENDNDARIAYSGFDFHYHLFGRDLTRKVDYVNVNNCLECSFSDYDKFEDLILHNANYEDWRENLEILEKDYIILRDSTMEYKWIQNMPNKFELIERFKNTYIFRITDT